MARSSSGLGRDPFKVEVAGSNPARATSKDYFWFQIYRKLQLLMPKSTIIHGEDTVASRNWLECTLIKFEEKHIFQAKSADLTSIEQIINTASLFTENRALIFENFFSLKKDAVISNVIGYASGTIFIWEQKTLSPSVLEKFKDCRIETFKPRQLIFTWLDQLKPGSYAKTTSLLHVLLNDDIAPELLWRLLLDRLRILLFLDSQSIHIADWQRSRLANQAKLFDKVLLKQVYCKAIDSEYALKVGRQVFPLSIQIEFLLSAIDRIG